VQGYSSCQKLKKKSSGFKKDVKIKKNKMAVKRYTFPLVSKQHHIYGESKTKFLPANIDLFSLSRQKGKF